MKKFALLIFLLQSCTFSGFSQFNSESTDSLLIEAKKAFFLNNYKESIPLFERFLAEKPEYIHSEIYYFIADAYLHLKKKKLAVDYFVKFAQKSNFSYYDHIIVDSAWSQFNRKNNKWEKILQQIKQNQTTREETQAKNKPISDRLITVMEDDQYLRMLSKDYEKKFGYNSPQIDSLWKIIYYNDSINQLYVCSI